MPEPPLSPLFDPCQAFLRANWQNLKWNHLHYECHVQILPQCYQAQPTDAPSV